MSDPRSRLSCEFDIEFRRATTESRVVRHRQGDVQEMENRRGKALSLSKGEMKELTDSEQSQYCRGSILERRARATRLSRVDPGVNYRLVNPECETSAASESFVIVFPVTDAVDGFGFLLVHSFRISASPHP